MRSKNIILIMFLIFSTLSYSQFLKEEIIFNSANPFSFHDIIHNLKNQKKQIVSGELTTPHDINQPNKKYPLIVGVAGSLGWKKHHYEYLTMYQELGFATFELKSFKSRSIESTVGDQTQVTTAAMILDAYRALELLSVHPKIKNDKISIIGWSLGGAVALFSAWIPLKNAINKNLSFASHLSFYPPCFIEPEDLRFVNSPIHILIGELDDWTPAAPCYNFVDKAIKQPKIGLTVYKNSHHGFDRQGGLEINRTGYSFKNCDFKLNKNGYVMMNYFNIPMKNPILQKIGFLFCTTRGVTIGGNPVARKKSFSFAKKFMIQTLFD